jgi:hypothetical protein
VNPTWGAGYTRIPIAGPKFMPAAQMLGLLYVQENWPLAGQVGVSICNLSWQMIGIRTTFGGH